jgi:hypothetical protein
MKKLVRLTAHTFRGRDRQLRFVWFVGVSVKFPLSAPYGLQSRIETGLFAHSAVVTCLVVD